MKNHFTLVLMLFLFSLLSLDVEAQTVKGIVLDAETGEELIGANIILKDNPGKGTVTDYDGSFELKVEALPTTVVVSYTGFEEKDVLISSADTPIKIELGNSPNVLDLNVVVKGQRVSEEQKKAPLTIESMDLLAIKETPADNFYDGLGTMKGVDLTAASLGFKVINTRGFNSTSPVRSLQLIDGVDNQAPGLNFSLGNFLGTSELDVLKVDLIVGASSAYYGPNAFNGVIAMTTKDPFFQKGLSASVKVGERNMFDTAIRWADTFKNKEDKEFFGYKLNLSYLRADDWEATNYDPVFDTDTGLGNPGGFDAVNIYGDEANNNFNLTDLVNSSGDFAGLGQYHRQGYKEEDVVNYDTRNLKSNVAFHFRLNPDLESESPTIIAAASYSNGTTVYQGDNRFSLKNIAFLQTRLELKKSDKYFLRAYYTQDDAGDSYDPYLTALRLQELAKSNADWGRDYANFWRRGDDSIDDPLVPRELMDELGYPESFIDFTTNPPMLVFDKEEASRWIEDNQSNLTDWHTLAQIFADMGSTGASQDFFAPGTQRFEDEFNRITSRKNNFIENGTKFFDKSALYHLVGEYKFDSDFFDEIRVGANTRLYTPISEGTVFSDTLSVEIEVDPVTFTRDTISITENPITNYEFGFYGGVSKKFANDKLTASATLRTDKNQNFDWLVSPAASLVFKPKAQNYLRLSFSSAIRNPTLTDQYLLLDVGRATLAGNINGVEGLITTESFEDFAESLNGDTLQFFDIAPVVPEKVKSFEIGYRTTLFNSLFVDASYYYSIYDDFLGYNIGIDAEFDSDGFPTSVEGYRYAANSTNQVTTQGFSIGMNYYFASYFGLSANYSWNRLNKVFEDDPIIPAFNTPEHKYNLGFSGRNIQTSFLKGWGFNVNYKWVQGFIFEGSPQFTGEIPDYGLLDGQINYNFKELNTTLKIGASNILNNLVFQTYGGPRIGRLAYVSLLYEFKKK